METTPKESSPWLYAIIKTINDAVIKSHQELNSIIEATPDIIYRLDSKGKISFINSAVRKYNYSPEKLLYQDILDLVHPDDRQKAMYRINERRTGKRSTQKLELRLLVKGQKKEHTFLIDVEGLYDQNKAFIGSQGVARDITEHKMSHLEQIKLEQKLHQTRKLESLNILAGGIAHDFNNMLMGILGNSEMALMDLPPASPVAKNIKQIKKITQRAADLTNQMLAYSGRCRFMVQPIDINLVIKEIQHLLRISIPKNITLKCDLTDHLPMFEADISQIRQIIMNLIINSSEAIGNKNGHITISTGMMVCDHADLENSWFNEEKQEGLYIYFEVTDTGCGIKKDEIYKIFDPFFSTKFIGRGLGLSAVQGIIRGHNGTIKISSEPEKGSTFKILFPASSASLSVMEEELQYENNSFANETILFVDDEEPVLAIGKQMLERAGFNVITAEDGNRAVDLFKKHAKIISCVLLDLAMPQMSGEETLNQLRNIRNDIRVIISSGYDEHEVNDRFPENTISGFIQKPYHYKKLVSQVYRVLKE